jgi:two-component system cell cycle response regulator DivK
MSERTKRILIVDDSETFLMYFSILLRRMGFDIIPADNGISALKLLRVLMPDVVILDIAMPHMDGITTLRHIKGDLHTSNIPVIMITVSANPKDYKECERLGCSGYLTKPVTVSDVHNTLHGCIGFLSKKRRLLRTSFEKKVSVTHNGVTSEHYAVSISEGGIYIREKNPLHIGTEVEVSVPLKDNEPLNVKGNVIYVKGMEGNLFKIAPGMAVAFKDVSNHTSETLHSFITDCLTKDIFEEQAEPVVSSEH